MPVVQFDSWPAGINNRAPVDRLPDGAARHLVNLTPTAAGKLRMRPGFQKRAAAQNVRASVKHNDSILLFDGADVLLFNPDGEYIQKIGEITAGSGYVAGASIGGVTYLCTPADMVRVVGNELRPWAVEAPAVNVGIGVGNLLPGTYRFAVTSMTADGIESGAIPVIVTLSGSNSVSIPVLLPPGAVSARCYASVENGDTLYLQDEKVSGSFVIANIVDSGARLTTENRVTPPHGEQVVAHNAQLLIASGNVLYMTEPFMPHLYHRVRGFVQYPEPISVVLSVGNVVYVCADKTYCLRDVGTDSVTQTELALFGAVKGTGVKLPDGTGGWMSKYGQVIATQAGTIEFPAQKSYAPPIAEYGSAAVLDCDGDQMIVTSMKGRIVANGLGLRDSYDLEIE